MQGIFRIPLSRLATLVTLSHKGRGKWVTLLILFFPAPATAACLMLTLADVPSVVTFQGGSGGYAVFDPAEYIQTVNFRVQGEATGATCEYFVTLSSGQSGNFSQRKLTQDVHTLNYNAYTNASKSNILKDSSGTASETITGSFPLPTGINLTQSADHNFVWTVDPLQAVPASATPYSDPALRLSLYSGLLTGIIAPTLEDTKTITFQARADSSVDLSLVESGAPFDISDTVQVIDFNTLESGEQRGFDVVVRSNNGYRVTMQSENNQRMIHERAPAIADTIDYTITLNGAEIDLTSGAPTDAALSTGTTTATGVRLPIEFTIGNMTGAETGGIYSDVINVEVTAN
ncbi:MAG: spore coat protein U domain-containing protein [Pseudomonadota bacterium]|nr:spore coat protein U domain-containing protein [Pseudomonadota bacterium]